MIIVTGGCGFIGSALIWKLNQITNEDIIIVDTLNTKDKWKNLVGLKYYKIINKEEFLDCLNNTINITTIFHLGANSETTNPNDEFLLQNNYKYTLKIIDFATKHNIKIVYASSAATYGNGETGYDDNIVEGLKPLNMYAYSKQMVDLYCLRQGYFKTNRVYGLKFFNVFGPNEYHKGSMRSILCKQFETLKNENKLKIFKAYHKDYKDGEQLRDFVYVKDVVNILIKFYEYNYIDSGIYNVGTGIPRTWNDLCNAAFKAMNVNGKIEYEDLPEVLKDKYQYYTCAKIDKLRTIKGLENYKFMTLEESVDDYINNYLYLDYKHLTN